VIGLTERFGNDSEGQRVIPGARNETDPEGELKVIKVLRKQARKAVRRFDTWTVEAFNPVYPHRSGRR
jgi:hypothetical protein